MLANTPSREHIICAEETEQRQRRMMARDLGEELKNAVTIIFQSYSVFTTCNLC